MFLVEKKRRQTLLLFVFVGLWVWLVGCGREEAVAESRATGPDVDQQLQLEQLNRSADELYQNAITGKFMIARDILIRLGDQASSIPFKGITTIEGMDVFMDAVVEAKRQFNAARIDSERAVKASARLKLATDALTHPNQPMWLQYYKVLLEDTKLLEQSIVSGKANEAKVRLGQLKDHYNMIRPSVWINRPPEEGEKMDSLLTFFTKYTEADNLQQEILKSGIEQWRAALDVLFRKTGDRTAYLPVIQPDKPVLWTMTVGSLIVAVLMFSAWRMFHIERNLIRTPHPRPMDDDR